MAPGRPLEPALGPAVGAAPGPMMRPLDELTRHGAHVMTVCNACRYCEQYCPVFPAMERRLTFGKADLEYLANLCHNCGECLYACQYAPPHEFGINVPKMLAETRLQSYETLCWPAFMGSAFRRQGLVTSLVLTAAFAAALALAVTAARPGVLHAADASADFYAVIPHLAMVGLFGGVSVFVLCAITIGLIRFQRVLAASASSAAQVPHGAGTLPTPALRRDRRLLRLSRAALLQAVRNALTLRHLHRADGDCVSAEETRRPWRRWCHHATFYGFALCFASTSVAAIYHSVFGWYAPYEYASLPVALGTAGGIGLIAGPAGLLVLMRRRDAALSDPAQDGLNVGFIALLLITSATGLALLAWRHQPIMASLLIVHLGAVLALFVSLPYGKFVHGFYRLLALCLSAEETAAD
jgi:citrate/tricarballylate utilization protein